LGPELVREVEDEEARLHEPELVVVGGEPRVRVGPGGGVGPDSEVVSGVGEGTAEHEHEREREHKSGETVHAGVLPRRRERERWMAATRAARSTGEPRAAREVMTRG